MSVVDFFVSYNQADRGWAEWIAWQLESVGHTTVIQAWDFRPGQNFVLAMNKAATEAARTIVVLSPAYLAARFTQPEWAAAFAQDPTGNSVLPVRVRECQPTGLLGPMVFIDLLGRSEAEARTTLLDGVRSGRGKPTRAPAFPIDGRSGPSFPGENVASAAAERAPPEAPAPAAETDADILRRIRARHLIELDTIDLDYDLAKVFHARAEIEAIVSDAASMLRSVDGSIDERAAIFGVQNLPSPPASPQRVWKAILMEAPLKGPRALAAILLRAQRLSSNKLPKLQAVLGALLAAPPATEALDGAAKPNRVPRQSAARQRRKPSGRARS